MTYNLKSRADNTLNTQYFFENFCNLRQIKCSLFPTISHGIILLHILLQPEKLVINLFDNTILHPDRLLEWDSELQT